MYLVSQSSALLVVFSVVGLSLHILQLPVSTNECLFSPAQVLGPISSSRSSTYPGSGACSCLRSCSALPKWLGCRSLTRANSSSSLFSPAWHTAFCTASTHRSWLTHSASQASPRIGEVCV